MMLPALLLAGIGVAEDQPAAAPQKKAAAKSAKPAPPLKLPAGAVEVEPYTYTYTDPKGVKWIYRKTPFGLARFEDKPAASTDAPAPPLGAGMTATDNGDSVRFERPGPFGVYRWEKKKDDLTGDERAAWQRSQTKSSEKAKQE
jgi:hypothetical protein